MKVADFKFKCPHCQQSLEAATDMSGSDVQCPVCGNTIVIPEPVKVPSIPPPPDTTIIPQCDDWELPPRYKICPFCAEEIMRNAIKCKHCGEYLVNRENDQPKKNTIVVNQKGGGGCGLIVIIALGIILAVVLLAIG
jgi:DNA-directed RNA polymerase subunit RPC12/RpoP